MLTFDDVIMEKPQETRPYLDIDFIRNWSRSIDRLIRL